MRVSAIYLLTIFAMFALPAFGQTTAEKIKAAIDSVNGKRGRYGSNSHVGSFQSQSASSPRCKIEVTGNILKIVSDEEGYEAEVISEVHTDFFTATGEKDGSFTSPLYTIKNDNNFCEGETITAKWEMRIEKPSPETYASVSIYRSGECAWKYQDHPMTSHSQGYGCLNLH